MMILEKICGLIKNSTKKVLVVGVLLGSTLGITGCDNSYFSQKQEIFTPSNVSIAAPALIKESKDKTKISEPNETRKNPELTTTVYGEGGLYRGKFDENPFLLNVMTGYNILDKEPEEGILYFPNFRMLTRIDKSKNIWNNHMDLGAGAAYLKPPFIVGVEGVHREPFEEQGQEGDFLRLWGGYWDRWEKKSLDDCSENPNRLWGTRYAEFEYNTLEKNLVATGRADAVLDMVNIEGFVAGPYVSGKVSMDAKNESWNRFGEAAAGIRIRKGIFNLFLESGYRDSFNNKGADGQYNAVYAGFWFRF